MITLLADFPSFSLSKILLPSLPVMLLHPSVEVLNFFEFNMFVSPTMQNTFMIPWVIDDNEFIFPSNTTIITEEAIIEAMGGKSLKSITKKT